VLTEADRRTAVDGLKLGEKKVHLIPNGVDTEKFQPPTPPQREEIRRRCLDVRGDEMVILMVGRLWQQKAPEVLLKAAAGLLRQQRDMRVVFIGDGELMETLKTEARQAEVESQVCFLGWRTDVPEILKGADIFVLPSRWEGLSIAILEAMAAGVPVVASDIPGNRAVICDGENGELFRMDNVDDLQKRLSELSSNREKRERYSRRGLDDIQRDHELGARMARLRALYLEIIDKKS